MRLWTPDTSVPMSIVMKVVSDLSKCMPGVGPTLELYAFNAPCVQRAFIQRELRSQLKWHFFSVFPLQKGWNSCRGVAFPVARRIPLFIRWRGGANKDVAHDYYGGRYRHSTSRLADSCRVPLIHLRAVTLLDGFLTEPNYRRRFYQRRIPRL